MNLIIIKEDKRAIPFSFKKEIKEKYIVYKIFDEHKLTAKRIHKKLNKDRIMSVAFDNNISHSFKKYFEGKVNIIKKEVYQLTTATNDATIASVDIIKRINN